jgi:hypothetical protein
MSIQFIPHAYCGLYCASCPDYRAAEKNISKKQSLTDSECLGCKSEHVKAGGCQTCNLKECARKKGLEFCIECTDYPCKDLEKFKTDKLYPYHAEVYGYLETIKKRGRNTWIEDMKKRWSCPECTAALIWWDTVCPECGMRVNGYEKY